MSNDTDTFDYDAFVFDTNELSLAAVGAWMKCLHKMRKSVTRGRISMPIEGYARMFGSTVDQARNVVNEIIQYEVADTADSTDERITLINRRMYRLSQKSNENGQLQQQPETPRNSTYVLPSSLNSSLPKETEERGKNICRVFAFWQTELNHPQAKLTLERRRCINARLEDGYTPQDLETAIRGCKSSPHHMGKNDNGTIYDDLTLICRNGSKVEQFKGYLRAPIAKSGAAQVGKSTTAAEKYDCTDCLDTGLVLVSDPAAEFDWVMKESPCPACASAVAV